jgi:hypothetical protein
VAKPTAATKPMIKEYPDVGVAEITMKIGPNVINTGTKKSNIFFIGLPPLLNGMS